MMNLETDYLGLQLAHPLVASASPLTSESGSICALEDAGAAAVVMNSLFEEQLTREDAAFESFLGAGNEAYAEALSYFPSVGAYRSTSDRYLEILRTAAERCDIPVIGSLNGVSAEGWTGYATGMEQAGAAAIELNVYHIPADLEESGEEVEERYLAVVRAVRAAVSVPVAVKLAPYFSAFGHMATRLVAAGADGLVLFNRFYQPDFDLESLEASPSLELSSPVEIRPGLLWLAALRGRLSASLAASSGVSGPEEAVKYLLAGADAVMTTSSLLRHGIGYMTTLRDGVHEWLDARGYRSVDQVRGLLSMENVVDPSAFERANYIRLLEGFEAPRPAH
jgi:dihydroorotate dehydrogenase (fumarate)